MASNYDINYEDERFKQVESDKQVALDNIDETYGEMLNGASKYYQDQITASKEWEQTQKNNQQAQTDFAIQQINQQKAQSEKDYQKEQSGAYVDWQRESNRYGANAEELAVSGMLNTGYGESSQVRMYNTYQNRIASARQSFELAKRNYDNAITEARLQNNSILAEIAYNAYQQQLELSLAEFQYKNSLVAEMESRKAETENNYYNRYLDVLNQINKENAIAIEKEQEEARLALEKEIQMAKLEEEKRLADLIYGAEQEVEDVADTPKVPESVSETVAKVKDPAPSNIQDYRLKTYANNDPILKSLIDKYGNNKNKSTNKNTVVDPDPLGNRNVDANKQGASIDATRVNPSSPVKTDYYEGDYNEDVKVFGTFNNGYQPKGIDGYGTVTKTGETIQFETQTLNGEKKTVTQNVWKTNDGSKWYWDGRYNKYIKM